VNDADDSIRVFIPLAFRKRNGRPKILPPEADPGFQVRSQAPDILRAVGRAWAWRRRMESGEVAAIQDIPAAENISNRFVSSIISLANLSSDALECLLPSRVSPSVTVKELATAASLPWPEQIRHVFDR
jgi:hypothetical protein